MHQLWFPSDELSIKTETTGLLFCADIMLAARSDDPRDKILMVERAWAVV